jgi:1,4-dihydroxy-2-naphthoate octaprenyltransferase
MLRDYIKEIFEPTLLFGVAAGLAGLAAASYYYDGAVIWLGAFAIIGAVAAQMAVNLIDDYTDYKTGLDMETSKTRFSGGSPLVAGNRVSAAAVLRLAVAALFVAGAIGVYTLLVAQAVAILILMLAAIGGIAAVFYARYLTHVPFLAEPFVAACFALIGIGVFLVASGSSADMLYVALACVPCGIQVGVAALINAMPDRKYGRRSWAVMLNDNRLSGFLYLGFEAAGYALLIFGMYARILPGTFAIMLAFVPVFQYIAMSTMDYKGPKSYEKVMGINAAAAMLYMFMLSASFMLAHIMA